MSRQKDILVRTVIFAAVIALCWAHTSCNRGAPTVQGKIRDIERTTEYVVFYFSKNRPSEGVAVPLWEFEDELLASGLKGSSAFVVAMLFTVGEKYRGETIRASGELKVQEDGSKLIFVKSLKDVHFIE